MTEIFPNNSRLIVFPDIEYSKYPNFWDEVEQYELGELPKNKEILNFLQKEINLINNAIDYESKLVEVKKYWETIENDFKQLLFTIYPEFQNKEINIVVNVKSYQTKVDFSSPNHSEKKNVNGYVSLRVDADPKRLIYGVLSTILSYDLAIGRTWIEKKAILDYITSIFITNLNLKSQISGKPLAEKLIVDDKILKNSRDFLIKNNIVTKSMFSITNDGNINLFDNNLKCKYFDAELKLLKSFIQKETHILDYDEIADILWQDEVFEKFSLANISKRIERLRKKLYEEGMPTTALRTVRGIGYYLNN